MSSQLLLLTLVLGAVTVTGLTASHWARCAICPRRAARGRWLYAAIIILVGGVGLLAASSMHSSSMSLGLILGLLFVSMLWDGPGQVVAG
jgi:uncharacterized membrane protein YidH (DUF202 family)